ncbi:hypothetical protein AMELA_G00134330 [Ameiurus melas]|uniref:Integrase catalytic domain-containing protein n=1 Tax=Ameiurus melas TaxID=219545 RepID=A0A7J6AN61_AMEME|nr:hypothetical protein AMELA_G00134330 [Ameiurus melas]
MDTSSCINAIRRFFAFRGPAKQLRSDCGINFIGACKELGMDNTIQRYLSEQGCIWEFNPPHDSYMGGSWEHMVSITMRILDAMLLKQNIRLTHEVLCTLMAELVCKRTKQTRQAELKTKFIEAMSFHHSMSLQNEQ